jgi:Family of unknown function (DUF6152)
MQSNLKSTRFIVLAVGIGLLLVSSSALAHHGANLYDMSKAVVLKGTVTKFYWGNPHNEVSFDATDEKGEVGHWVAYTEPPLVMLERGWTRKSIPVGDKVTVYIFAAKNGSTVGTLNKIVLSDGKELTAYGARGTAAPAPAPK